MLTDDISFNIEMGSSSFRISTMKSICVAFYDDYFKKSTLPFLLNQKGNLYKCNILDYE